MALLSLTANKYVPVVSGISYPGIYNYFQQKGKYFKIHVHSKMFKPIFYLMYEVGNFYQYFSFCTVMNEHES
jgi:hypothetical protein